MTENELFIFGGNELEMWVFENITGDCWSSRAKVLVVVNCSGREKMILCQKGFAQVILSLSQGLKIGSLQTEKPENWT